MMHRRRRLVPLSQPQKDDNGGKIENGGVVPAVVQHRDHDHEHHLSVAKRPQTRSGSRRGINNDAAGLSQ